MPRAQLELWTAFHTHLFPEGHAAAEKCAELPDVPDEPCQGSEAERQSHEVLDRGDGDAGVPSYVAHGQCNHSKDCKQKWRFQVLPTQVLWQIQGDHSADVPAASESAREANAKKFAHMKPLAATRLAQRHFPEAKSCQVF